MQTAKKQKKTKQNKTPHAQFLPPSYPLTHTALEYNTLWQGGLETQEHPGHYL